MILATAVNRALLTLVAACVLLAAVTAIRRAMRVRLAARRDRTLEPLRPVLLDLLAGDDAQVTAATARLRGVTAREWRACEPVLLEYLGKFRGAAVNPLREILTARGAIRRVRAAVGARSPVVRAGAARTLGLLDVRGGVPVLVRLLRDRDPQVRIVAARALGRLAEPATASALFAALSGSRTVPAGVVAEALVQFGDGAAGAVGQALGAGTLVEREVAADVAGLTGAVALTGALRARLELEPDPDVRAHVATSLGRLGNPSALAGLRAALAATNPAVVRSAAAEALGSLGDDGAVPALGSLLDEPGSLADVAAAALVRLGPAGLAALRAAAGQIPSAAAGALAVAALRGEPVPR
ncbi:MAG: hypothetical protein EPN43_14530 [Jatrophihabitans sp.]|nr:MAG: hypothetical protein EPN43_14530 [Jatrophihabitans sp.]